MELKSSIHVDKMGVVIDGDNDKAEVVKVDTVKLLRFHIDFLRRQMIISMAWGGYANDGRWFWSNLNASERSINGEVDGEREIFNACAFDEKGNPRDHLDFPQILEQVLFDHNKINDVIQG